MFINVPDDNNDESNQYRALVDETVRFCLKFQMCQVASSPYRVPAESPKTVTKQINAEDHWANDSERKQPNEYTSTNSDRCPGNAPEELRQDKAHTGDEGDGGHCEEVRVRDQAAHKS